MSKNIFALTISLISLIIIANNIQGICKDKGGGIITAKDQITCEAKGGRWVTEATK